MGPTGADRALTFGLSGTPTLRLRGGVARKAGLKSFVDASGARIDVGEDGEIVGSHKSSQINQVMQKRSKLYQGKERQPTLKKRIGKERRERTKAKLQEDIDQAIRSIPAEGRIKREDPNWMPFLRAAEDAVPRETLMGKLERQAAMQKTSYQETEKVGRKMFKTSRRKGRRTVKHLTEKQRTSMEKAYEYKMSGKKEQRAYEKDQTRRHLNAAYQIVTENLEDAAPGTEANMTAKEKRLQRALKVKKFNPDGRRLLDDGKANLQMEFETLRQITKEVHGDWKQKREEAKKKEAEKLAYITSKEYIKKRKELDKKKRRMAAMRKKVEESKRSNRLKKQEKLLGQDRTVVNPNKVGFSSSSSQVKAQFAAAGSKSKQTNRQKASAEKKKNRKSKRP